MAWPPPHDVPTHYLIAPPRSPAAADPLPFAAASSQGKPVSLQQVASLLCEQLPAGQGGPLLQVAGLLPIPPPTTCKGQAHNAAMQAHSDAMHAQVGSDSCTKEVAVIQEGAAVVQKGVAVI